MNKLPGWRALVSALSWHRRRLAAVAAAIAVGATIMALRPDAPPTEPVLVAASSLASGQRITADDLRVVHWPLGTAPESAVSDQAQLIDRVVASPLTAGTPFTEVSVVSPRLAAPGRAVVPIQLADKSLVAVLRVGDTIDVLTSGPDGPVELARNARVVTLPHEASDGGMFGPSGSAVPILIEVTDSEAKHVASVSGSSVSIILR